MQAPGQISSQPLSPLWQLRPVTRLSSGVDPELLRLIHQKWGARVGVLMRSLHYYPASPLERGRAWKWRVWNRVAWSAGLVGKQARAGELTLPSDIGPASTPPLRPQPSQCNPHLITGCHSYQAPSITCHRAQSRGKPLRESGSIPGLHWDN